MYNIVCVCIYNVDVYKWVNTVWVYVYCMYIQTHICYILIGVFLYFQVKSPTNVRCAEKRSAKAPTSSHTAANTRASSPSAAICALKASSAKWTCGDTGRPSTAWNELRTTTHTHRKHYRDTDQILHIDTRTPSWRPPSRTRLCDFILFIMSFVWCCFLFRFM